MRAVLLQVYCCLNVILYLHLCLCLDKCVCVLILHVYGCLNVRLRLHACVCFDICLRCVIACVLLFVYNIAFAFAIAYSINACVL